MKRILLNILIVVTTILNTVVLIVVINLLSCDNIFESMVFISKYNLFQYLWVISLSIAITSILLLYLLAVINNRHHLKNTDQIL